MRKSRPTPRVNCSVVTVANGWIAVGRSARLLRNQGPTVAISSASCTRKTQGAAQIQRTSCITFLAEPSSASSPRPLHRFTKTLWHRLFRILHVRVHPRDPACPLIQVGLVRRDAVVLVRIHVQRRRL